MDTTEYSVEAHRNGKLVFFKRVTGLRDMFDSVKQATLLSLTEAPIVRVAGRDLTTDEQWTVNHAFASAA